MADIPDFRTHTPAIDPMAFANVLQRKGEIEQQQRNYEQKRKDDQINNIMEAVKTGQQIASNMMTLSEKRNQAQGLKDLTGLISAPPVTPPSPTASSTALPEAGKFNVQPSPEQNAGYQDQLKQRQNDMLSALIKANPDDTTKELIKARMNPNGSNSDRYQQSALQTIGPDGRPITVATTFDKVTGQQINPLTGKPIQTDEDMKGLSQRGYAQSTRATGYTADGREVFSDTRSGKKYTIETDDNGNQKTINYTERIYPKLENPPAKWTESIAELGNAQVLLKDITKSFDPTYVGPVAARAGKMTKYVDALTETQKVEFYGNVAEYKNSIIKAITGAQMSETEAKRIVQQIPDENSSPTAFLAGVKRAYAMTDRRLKQQEIAIQRSGGVVRGENESPISQEELTQLIDEKLGKINNVPESTRTVQTVTKLKDMTLEELKAYKQSLLEKKRK